MFIPMNMEGTNTRDSFWTLGKTVTVSCIIIGLAYIIVSLSLGEMNLRLAALLGIVWAVATFYATRFIIFEEKMYKKQYDEMKKHKITSPALFWDIASIKDTKDGAILTYGDGKIGVMVKLEGDTITGKPDNFEEQHYDAISDFYHKLMDYRYNFIQMSIMEHAGNDPRLTELDKLITKNKNINIQRLIELEVGYTKAITRRTLYESDIYLVYTKDTTRIDTILNDVEESLYELMSGAYIGFRFFNSKDVMEFVKNQFGVDYFNRTEATLDMLKTKGLQTKPTFKVKGFYDAEGRKYNISDKMEKKLSLMAKTYGDGNTEYKDKSMVEEFILKDPDYKRTHISYNSLFNDSVKMPAARTKEQIELAHKNEGIQDSELKTPKEVTRDSDKALHGQIPNLKKDKPKDIKVDKKVQNRDSINQDSASDRALKRDEYINNLDDLEIDFGDTLDDDTEVDF